ncbi:MAG: ketoacyl-ACP synthase III [Rickettsiales bacterium]|nr:ketoacyl-ACP synthase III [Rickettsiales bacterium]
MDIYASIKAIEYYLPDKVLTNEQLAKSFTELTVEKIKNKTGIENRHVATLNESVSDLAYKAAVKLFDSDVCRADEIDFLLLCTQTPDYFVPATACILQDRLNIPTTSGALDFNIGCSGYIYGLSLAKGLIETNQAKRVLFITTDIYSRYLRSDDKTVVTIFGDAASATLIEAIKSSTPALDSFVFGTDGIGANNIIVRGGAMRERDMHPELYMNGPEVFASALRTVPNLVKKILANSNYEFKNIDLFIFHQANKYLLDHLRDKLKIPKDKFYIFIQKVGNTVSSSIPIALRNAMDEKKISSGSVVMLVGFGAGYSRAGTILKVA